MGKIKGNKANFTVKREKNEHFYRNDAKASLRPKASPHPKASPRAKASPQPKASQFPQTKRKKTLILSQKACTMENAE